MQPNICALGHLWGKDVEVLLSNNDNNKFDIIILADVLFNHR